MISMARMMGASSVSFAVSAAARSLVLLGDPARPVQIVIAGKAHPQDEPGKQLIREVVDKAHGLNNKLLQIVYLENYSWDLGALLTAGVDVWVNTPKRPYEA